MSKAQYRVLISPLTLYVIRDDGKVTTASEWVRKTGTYIDPRMVYGYDLARYASMTRRDIKGWLA